MYITFGILFCLVLLNKHTQTQLLRSVLQTLVIIEGFSTSKTYSLFLTTNTLPHLSELVKVIFLSFAFISTALV